ncbi:hypothetical protein L6164_023705 [Bauhinia variegata]|uniref:Uncharacterized protein n=1 Tax=Bauhinia variegata TaxID=167791 RepID=A0ACB9MJI3_BAUVA|nr:hypothetical protein L6164_023705 [Bauhinia variegata]
MYDDRGSDGKSLPKKQPDSQKKSYSGLLSCYVCKGPHRMKDFPKLGSLAAMVEEKEKYEEKPGIKLSSLRLLNTIKAKPLSKSEGLMYVNTKLNGKSVSVVVDTGPTHNFITLEEATRISLNVAHGGGWVKTMNSSPKQLNGIARWLELCLGSWKGKVDFSIVPMNDFKVILRMDFLRKVNVYPMWYYDTLCILEKGITCMVPIASRTRDISSVHLSAMQLKKGLKKGETTYLATLKEEGSRDELDAGVPKQVLKKNQYMMPPKLPKKLPPRKIDILL